MGEAKFHSCLFNVVYYIMIIGIEVSAIYIEFNVLVSFQAPPSTLAHGDNFVNTRKHKNCLVMKVTVKF